MTEKVFWADPYLTEITANVTHIHGNEVELSRTVFYAESGGQESDTGTIGGVPVINARKSGHGIIYTLESAPGFAVGDEVVCKIDWPRRTPDEAAFRCGSGA